MKTLKVVAAIIENDSSVLATQRGYGELKDKWEFPGGKIEVGETPEKALEREISEELNLSIDVGDCLTTVEYDYPDYHLSMQCFICRIRDGSLILKEHKSARWLTVDDLWSVDWLPADIKVVEIIGERWPSRI